MEEYHRSHVWLIKKFCVAFFLLTENTGSSVTGLLSGSFPVDFEDLF